MKRLPVARRAGAGSPRRVFGVLLLRFVALGGRVPAPEAPTPPPELPVQQERSAPPGSAGPSGCARPADALRGRGPCAGTASLPARRAESRGGRGRPAPPPRTESPRPGQPAPPTPPPPRAGGQALRAGGAAGPGCGGWQRAASLPPQITQHRSPQPLPSIRTASLEPLPHHPAPRPVWVWGFFGLGLGLGWVRWFFFFYNFVINCCTRVRNGNNPARPDGCYDLLSLEFLPPSRALFAVTVWAQI